LSHRGVLIRLSSPGQGTKPDINGCYRTFRHSSNVRRGVPRHEARPIIQSVVWIRGRKLLPPSDCGLQSTHRKPHPNHLSNLRSGPCASWCVPCNAEGLRLSWDCRHQGAASAAQKTRAKTLRQSSFSAFTSSSLVAGAIDLVPTFRNAAANLP
jgi:hypothetical protein